MFPVGTFRVFFAVVKRRLAVRSKKFVETHRCNLRVIIRSHTLQDVHPLMTYVGDPAERCLNREAACFGRSSFLISFD